MKNNLLRKALPFTVALIMLCFIVLASGCSGKPEQNAETAKNTVAIELDGNPTTGYTWVYTMSKEGIVKEVSNDYIDENDDEELVGSGGKFVFVFEAVASGEVELVFSYLREWEEDEPAVETIVYKLTVDSEGVLMAEKTSANTSSNTQAPSGNSEAGDALAIPSEFSSLKINGFESLWPEAEDGSDLIGSVIFTSNDSEYTTVLGYIDGQNLSEAANSGNFMPNFSFVPEGDEGNGYDFVFTGDDELILRAPDGMCSKVDIEGGQFNELKDYIASICMNRFPIDL